MKVYISGPMRGIARYNFAMFDSVAQALRHAGHEPISPAEIDREAGLHPEQLPESHDWHQAPEGFDLDAAIRKDVDAILQADVMVMLPGSIMSQGAKAENAIATWRGMLVIPIGGPHDTHCIDALYAESKWEVKA